MNDAFPRGLGGGKLLGLVTALMVAVGIPAFALAHDSAKIVGNPKAGKPLFVSTCGVCHTLKAAGTVGNVGPNLDKVAPLTEPVIMKAITYGGATVMSKAAAGRYTTRMFAYKGALTTDQINNIAAYVYTSTHKP